MASSSLQNYQPLQRQSVLLHHRAPFLCETYSIMHAVQSLKLQHPKVLNYRLSPAYSTHALVSANNHLPQEVMKSYNDHRSNLMDRQPAVLSFREKLEECTTVASGLLLATLATVSLALSTSSCALASSASIAEVEAVKGIAVRAWTVVRDTYVDDTFNHQNWDWTLQKALDEISTANSRDEAYARLQAMLATLEDPYTRIMPPKEFDSFQISKDGSVEGVGLLLGSDQRSGRLYVLSPIKGGPAARAGVMSGDELVQIDGEVIKGMNGEEAATRLRGRVGTSVTLRLYREEVSINDAIGVPGSTASEIKIKLLREKVMLSPVSMAILPYTLPDGHVSRFGYIHISTFSESAAHEMEKVIRDMEQKDVNSYILDLRDNPGGLVRIGLEVAEMWLDSNEIVMNTIDRDGNMETVRLGADSRPLTKDPLIVLLNGNSASASEIVAGALHDNGRALLVGQRSFGKGKIQSVSELQDGSGLFVTIAKYLSPSLHDIDKKGITPDVGCSLPLVDVDVDDDSVSSTEAETSLLLQHPSIVVSANNRDIAGKDPCVLAAQQQLGVLMSMY